MYNHVLFVERTGELRYAARLRTEGSEPKRKRVLIGRKLHDADPKRLESRAEDGDSPVGGCENR